MFTFYERQFNRRIREMKALLAGIRKHKHDPGFPLEIKEEEIEAMIDRLRERRRDVEEQLARLRKSRARYLAAKKNLSEARDLVLESCFNPYDAAVFGDGLAVQTDEDEIPPRDESYFD